MEIRTRKINYHLRKEVLLGRERVMRLGNISRPILIAFSIISFNVCSHSSQMILENPTNSICGLVPGQMLCASSCVVPRPPKLFGWCLVVPNVTPRDAQKSVLGYQPRAWTLLQLFEEILRL